MTSLDDKILGYKSQNYVSSSEGEEENDSGNEEREEGATSAEVELQSSTFRSKTPKVLYCNIWE